MRRFALYLTFFLACLEGRAQEFVWAAQSGTAGNDWGTQVSLSKNGDVYMQSYTTEDGNITLSKYDTSGKLLWAKTLTASADKKETAGMAISPAGDIYLLWQFEGELTTAEGTSFKSLGQHDLFIAKYGSEGTFQWGYPIGGPNEDAGHSLVCDDAGNVFFCGYYTSGITFNGKIKGMPMKDATTTGQTAFIVKYTKDGQPEWVRTDRSSTLQQHTCLYMDGLSNIYVAGQFTGSTRIANQDMTSRGDWDMYLMKLDSKGTASWVVQAGGEGEDIPKCIAGKDSSVYLAGTITGHADFGDRSITSAGGMDIFLAKYTQDGQAEWAVRQGGAATDMPWAIEVAQNDNIIMAGGFVQLASFGETQLQAEGAKGYLDVFLAEYNAKGVALWASSAGSQRPDDSRGLAIDNKGNVYVAGWFQDTAHFGEHTLVSKGYTDAFVSRMYYRQPDNISYKMSCYDGHVSFVMHTYEQPDSVVWNFGDAGAAANTATGMSAEHIYHKGGQYEIVATVYTAGQAKPVYLSISVDETLYGILGPDAVICKGEAIDINLEPRYAVYQWSDGVEGAHRQITKPGQYILTIYSGEQCKFTDTLNVAYLNEVNIGRDTVVCSGEQYRIDLPAGAYYTWSDGSTANSFTVNAPGTYWVRSVKNGCAVYDTVEVYYRDMPRASFPADTVICMDARLVLDVSDINANIRWQDGSTAQHYLIDQPGTYTLEMTGSCGTTTQQINVKTTDCSCYLYVPDAFSPDANSVNDAFMAVSGCAMGEFRMQIINRWGETVFESNDINQGWDGTYKGAPAPAGSYSWTVDAMSDRPDVDVQKVFHEKGRLQLIR